MSVIPLCFQVPLTLSSIRLHRHLPKCPLKRGSLPFTFHHQSRRFVRCVPYATTTRSNSSSEVLLDKTMYVSPPGQQTGSGGNGKEEKTEIWLRAEALGKRSRCVQGSVWIETTKERVWKVLTSYEHLKDYMPNVLKSDLVWFNGERRLEQMGLLSRKLGLKSTMLMKIEQDDQERKWIRFTRLKGRDFIEFEGTWFIEEDVKDDKNGIKLRYELTMTPFPLFPMALVDRKMYKEMPGMLAAVRQEALVGKYIPFD